jgi:hypothetical protein
MNMATLTKSDELKLFHKLVEAMPDGYVRDMLVEAAPFVERDMSNDICTETISGLLRERAERTAEVELLKKQVREGWKEATEAQAATEKAKRELQFLKDEFAALASRAFQLSK